MVVTTTDVAQVKVRRRVGLPESPKPGWHARATRWRWMAAPAALAVGVRVISLLLADLALRMLVAVGVLAPSRYLGVIESWRVYDAVWYMHIAQLGYDAAPPRNLVTFFPLYPLLIRPLGAPLAALGVPAAYLLAAMLVSWAAFTAACVLLYRLALPRLGHIGALSAVALLALFPFAFFFGAAYSESVFLLAAVGAFCAVERQRWATAAIVAAFAGALRPPGVLLGLAVAIAYGAHLLHEGRRPDRTAFWLALMPAGLLAYFAYLWLRFGDFFAYQHASARGWHGGTLQWGGITSTLGYLLNANALFTGKQFNPMLFALYAVLAVVFLALCVPLWSRFGPHYAFFVLSGIVAPLATFPTPASLGRYLSVLFPAFLVAADLLGRHPIARQLVVLASGALLCLMALLFVLGGMD